MNRIEENEEMIKKISELNLVNPKGTYEQIAILKMNNIESALIDISKSLALIAERSEKNG